MFSLIFDAIILFLAIALISSVVNIVPQTEVRIVERLGQFHAIWSGGIHFKIPLIDRLSPVISTKESILDFRPQPVITKDNVTVEIDSVTYVQVIDPKKYFYGVDNVERALENLTATTLRSVIGEMELDETLSERDKINTRMQSVLDEATDKWGIKVNRVEIKNVMPPKDIQDAMESQMRAERERRANILEAEGKKKASILKAEGEKESSILKAEAEKQSSIRLAEGKKQSAILEAEGQAEALRKVQQAEAESLTTLSGANISKEVIRLKELEAVKNMAEGQATKLIVPSDLQDLSQKTSVVSENL